MKTYLYKGPKGGVTLRLKDATTGELTDHEVSLNTGALVDLPADHEYTKLLLAMGHLDEQDDLPAKRPALAAVPTATPTPKLPAPAPAPTEV
jgi:hypothetical protein